MKQSLPNSIFLKIHTSEKIYIGGSQSWYPTQWQRMSGCGPVAASNLIWYLTHSNPNMQSLCDIEISDKAHYYTLMNEMFIFMTPGAGGINSAQLFVGGLNEYCSNHGVILKTHVLDIPKSKQLRPSQNQMRDFILTALKSDMPVAFLNLSNGKLHNLESWHWVTIIELETNNMTAQISDDGDTLDIDLKLWLETSILGGAMVWLAE